jgi:hypothetical protein
MLLQKAKCQVEQGQVILNVNRQIHKNELLRWDFLITVNVEALWSDAALAAAQ